MENKFDKYSKLRDIEAGSVLLAWCGTPGYPHKYQTLFTLFWFTDDTTKENINSKKYIKFLKKLIISQILSNCDLLFNYLIKYRSIRESVKDSLIYISKTSIINLNHFKISIKNLFKS